MLLDDLKENGLKGELVDFVSVDFTFSFTQAVVGDIEFF